MTVSVDTTAIAQQVTGTRIRIQRLRDAKLFSGWVEAATSGMVHLSVNQADALKVGDDLFCECHTFSQRVVLQGTIDRVFGAGEMQRYSLRLTSAPKALNGSESPRFRTPCSPIDATHAGSEFGGVLLDASVAGMGVALEVRVDRGETIALTIHTPFGDVSGECEVRWSRLETTEEGYRTGLLIKQMARESAEVWVRFVRAVACGERSAA